MRTYPAYTVIALAIASLFSTKTYAEAVIDNSWGRTTQTLNGNFTIPQALGKLSGKNLFHSFKTFNINSGESATFTTSNARIANVIARVSGNDPSTINGLLRLQPLEGGKPSFFFINPNGVTFGSGAQIDVPGSFHVSTAKYLQFADGTEFKAGNGPDSTFTVAAPAAFGFLSSQAGGLIQFKNANATTLNEDSILSITANNIDITNSQFGAPDGRIQLIAVGDKTANIHLNMPFTDKVNGNIDIASSTFDVGSVYDSKTSTYVGGLGGGEFAVNGGNVSINESKILSIHPDFRTSKMLEFPDFWNAMQISIDAFNLKGDEGRNARNVKSNGAMTFLANNLSLRETEVVRDGNNGSISMIAADKVDIEGKRISLWGQTLKNPWMSPGDITVKGKNIEAITETQLFFYGMEKHGMLFSTQINQSISLLPPCYFFQYKVIIRKVATFKLSLL